MNENLRRKILFGLLAGTIAISIYTFLKPDQNEAIVGATSNSRQRGLEKQVTTTNAISATSAIHDGSQRAFYIPTINIFSGEQPVAPEPQATNVAVKVEESHITTVDVQSQVLAPLPPPMPAPPPFKFIGKLYGDDEYIVFLNYNGKNIAVKTGEVLFDRYKVEEIKPPTMTLVNLPLSSKETISIGEP